MSMSSSSHTRFSRRALVGSSLVGGAIASVGARTRAAAPATRRLAAPPTQGAAIPAGWRLWLLDAADELRPSAPGAPTDDEIEEVVSFQAEPTEEMAAAIARWGSGPANLPWSA